MMDTLDTFQQLFVNALVDAVLSPRVDQYGNQQQTALHGLFTQWWEQNRSTIIPLVVAKIDTDDMIEKIAEKLRDVITGRAAGFHVEQQQESFRKMVLEKIAERIAAEVELPTYG